MQRKSNHSRYSTVAIAIHWLSAFFVILMIGSGFTASQTLDSESKASILALHAYSGIILFLLTFSRINWWLFFDDRPQSIEGSPGWQVKSARIVHRIFYVIIIGMTASGIGMMVLSGAGPVIFTGAQETLPDFHNYPPRIPHGLGGRAIVFLLVIHISAALFHHFIKRDITLSRMLPAVFRRNS